MCSSLPRWDYMLCILLFPYLHSWLPWKISVMHVLTTILILYYRILLAYIKFVGGYPCPCCLILKADIIQMRSEGNMVTCQTNTQHSGQELITKVWKAQKLIFHTRATVNSTCVQSILQSESLVPTHVRATVCQSDTHFQQFFSRIHLANTFLMMCSTSFVC